MSTYAKIKDNIVIQYPYTFSELQLDNPYTNYGNNTDIVEIFPTTNLFANGYSLVPVTIESIPIYDYSTQKAVKDTVPVFENNNWILKWSVVTKTQQEQIEDNTKQAEEIRLERNQKLNESDWTQLQDSPVDKNLWATYRQNLRDITLQPGFPWNVTWPSIPT